MPRVLVVGEAGAEIATLFPPDWEVAVGQGVGGAAVSVAFGVEAALGAVRRAEPTAGLVALLPGGQAGRAGEVVAADPLAVVLVAPFTAAAVAEAVTLAHLLAGPALEPARLRGALRRRGELAEVPRAAPGSATDEEIHTARMVALGGLAGGVAHEVNNPLATILAFTQIMLADPRPAGDLEALHHIENSALRCKRVMEGMLRFSRRSVLALEPSDLNQVVREAVLLFEVVIKTHPRIHLALALADQAPLALLDAGLLEQVLVNLLQNAVQAMPDDAGEITVRTGAADGLSFMSVEDTGSGIAPAHLPRLFERGFTTKPAGVGTGLGLSIARDIVARHRGRLEVQSAPGKGSTFTVSIPSLPPGEPA